MEVVDVVNLYSFAKSKICFCFNLSVGEYGVVVQRRVKMVKRMEGGLNMKEVVCIKAQCQKVRNCPFSCNV